MKEKESGFSKSFYLITFAILTMAIVFALKYIPSSRYEVFIGTGTSMEPTLFNNDEITVDPQAIPERGDVIVFDCISCEGYSGSGTLTKRIYEIDQQGCFWVMGDNKEISYDSRIAGWLCPGQNIEVHGVVIKITHSQ